MNEMKLPMIIYNDLWMGCLDNNVIGVLLTISDQFYRLPCFYESTYGIRYLKDPDQMDKNDLSGHINLGWLALKATFNRPDLSRWIEYKEVQLSYDELSIDSIKGMLMKGYYLFFYMDRFHYPKGVEFQVRHLKHPSFFVGFNDEKQHFILAEDCVKLGYINYYELPYENFIMSYREVYNPTDTAALQCFQLTDDATQHQLEITRVSVIVNLTKHLGLFRHETPEFYEYYGLGAILHYVEVIEQVIPSIMEVNLIQQTVNEPMTHLKLKMMTIELLAENRLLNEKPKVELLKMYTELLESWTTFKIKLLKFIKMKYLEIPIGPEFYSDLKAQLLEMYGEEKRATELFIQYLKEAE